MTDENKADGAPAPLYAVSEQGTHLQHTDEEVNFALRLLILNKGNVLRTVDQLEEKGCSLHRNTLSKWRDQQFPTRFARLRYELGPDVTEHLAGDALEIANLAAEAERQYIAKAIDKLDEVDPNHLAKNAHSLANAKATNIQAAQPLRDKPTQIIETRSVEELIGELERLKVLKPDRAVIDAEAVDEDD